MALDDKTIQALLGAVGPQKPIGNTAPSGGVNPETLPDDLRNLMKALAKYVEELNTEYKASGKTVKKTTDGLDDMQKLLGKVGKQFDKMVGNSVGINKTLQKEKKERANASKLEAGLHKKAATMLGIGGGGRRGGGGGGGRVGITLPSGSGENDGLRYAEAFEETASRGLANFFAGLSTAILGYDFYQTLTDGIFRQSRRYIMEMKEIAYQTQGITQEAHAMQMQFMKTEKVVQRTGYSLTVYQNALIDASKRGLKNTQETLKTGLNLARVMGLTKEEAVQVSDTFLQWKGTLGLTDNELADVSRGIQEVSRFSGLTGRNLMDAVKASEKFMDNMRAAGNLTAASAKNVVGLQAELQKRGVADAFSNVQQGMSNSAKLLFESSAETQALLFNSAALVGRTEDAFTGMITQTKGGMKDLATGMKQYFANITGGIDFSQIENLNPMLKTQLNLVVTKATGMGLDDYRRSVESLEESSKTYVDRLFDINKELNKNVNTEQRLALERKKQDLTLTKSFEFSSALSDAVKETDRMTEAVTLMQTKLGPGWADMKTELVQITKELIPDMASAVAGGDKLATAKAIGLSSAKSLKNAGGMDLSKQILDAIRKNDMTKFQNLQMKMNAEQQKLGIKTIAELDPMTEVHQQLLKMNEQIRDSLTPILEGILVAVGGVGVYAGGVAATGASAYFAGETGNSILDIMSLLTGKGSPSSSPPGASPQTASNVVGQVSSPQVTGTISGGPSSPGGQVTGTISGGPSSPGGQVTGTIMGVAKAPFKMAASGLNNVAGTIATMAKAPFKLAISGVKGVTKTIFAIAMAPFNIVAAGLNTIFGAIMFIVKAPFKLAIAGFKGIIGGVIGALAAATEAADMFEVAQEDLTMGQYYAAKAAGALTGALNWLTFGIFDKWLNISSDLTKAIARVNEQFPVLSVGIMILEGGLGVLWGIVKAVSEVAKGIGEFVYLVSEPIMVVFKEIFNVVKEFLEPLDLFSAKLSETGTVFHNVTETIKGIGVAIRWALRIFGKIINVLFKTILQPIIMALRVVAKIANGVGKILGRVFEGLGTYILGIWQVIQGIFTFDIKKIFKGMISQIRGVIKTLVSLTIGLIVGIPQMILNAMAAIPLYIGTMFDEMEGTFGAILKTIVMPFKIIGKFFTAIADTLGGVYEMVVGLLTLDFSRFGNGLWNVISTIPAMIWDALSDIGNNLYKVFVEFPMWLLKKTMDAFSYVFMELPIAILNSLWSGLENLTANEWIGPMFEPFKEVFYELHDAIKPMYEAFVELYNEIFSGEMTSMLELLKPIVRSLAKAIGLLIKVALLPVIQAIKVFAAVTGVITNFFKGLTEIVKGLKSNPLKTAVTGVITNFFKGLTEIVKGLKSNPLKTVSEIFASPLKSTMGMFTAAGKAFTNLLPTTIGSGLKDAVQMMLDYLKEKLTGLKDSFKSLIPGYDYFFGKKKPPVAAAKPQKFDWNTQAAGNPEDMKKFHKTLGGINEIPQKQRDALLKQQTKQVGQNGKMLVPKTDFGKTQKALPKIVDTNQGPLIQSVFDAPMPTQRPEQQVGQNGKMLVPKPDFGKTQKALPKIVDTNQGPLIQSVFDAPMPTQRPEAVRVTAAGLPDTNQEKFFGDQAASKNVSSKSSAQEMSGMLAVNEDQLHYMQLIHSDMSKLVDLMTPKTSGEGDREKADTRSKIKPRSSPNFYAWQFGRNSQNASKQVIVS